jgi:hypothetical protein
MDLQQSPETPGVPETGLHKLARGVIVSWMTSWVAGMGFVAIALFVFIGPLQGSALNPTPFGRALFVLALALQIVPGLCYALWGCLQLLYPDVFAAPTTIRAQGAEQKTKRIRPMFSVCRRLRFWGIMGILTGLVWSARYLGLAMAFATSQILPAIPFFGYIVGLLFALGMQLLAYPDACHKYR